MLQFQCWQVVLAGSVLAVVLETLSGAVRRGPARSGARYHFIFLKAARGGWPGLSPLVALMLWLMLRPIVQSILRLIALGEMAQKDRLVRGHYGCHGAERGRDAAKLVKLKTMGERVCGPACMKADELKLLQPNGGSTRAAGGKRGPYVLVPNPSLEQLQSLRSGLDFPAATATPIAAAAGGIVVTKKWHPAYGPRWKSTEATAWSRAVRADGRPAAGSAGAFLPAACWVVRRPRTDVAARPGRR